MIAYLNKKKDYPLLVKKIAPQEEILMLKNRAWKFSNTIILTK